MHLELFFEDVYLAFLARICLDCSHLSSFLNLLISHLIKVPASVCMLYMYVFINWCHYFIDISRCFICSIFMFFVFLQSLEILSQKYFFSVTYFIMSLVGHIRFLQNIGCGKNMFTQHIPDFLWRRTKTVMTWIKESLSRYQSSMLKTSLSNHFFMWLLADIFAQLVYCKS